MVEIAIDLPFPPSVNRVWRSRRLNGRVIVHRSTTYTKWMKQAHLEWMAQKPPGLFKTIDQGFKYTLILSRPDRRRRDSRNYDKAVLDWAQHAGLIKDDSLALDSRIRWGLDEEAPMGARLIIKTL